MNIATLAEASIDARTAAASRYLRAVGWEIATATANLDSGTMLLVARRNDGLIITLHSSGGRASLTREMVSLESVQIGAGGGRGRGFRVDRLVTRMIGRTHAEGARSAMRMLANYIGDNPAPLCIADRKGSRTAIRLIMNALDAPPETP